jgi:hypothetical protein
MKRLFFLLIFPFLLSAEAESFDEVLAPPIAPEAVLFDFFQLDDRLDWISKSRVTSKEFEGISLGFSEMDARAGYAYPCGYGMLSAAGGYQISWLKLCDTPFFGQKIFENAYGTIGGRFFKNQWAVQGEFQYNVDLNRGSKNGALYFFGGWGTYYFSPQFTTSVGFLARYGIEQDKLWPVLGFEWYFSPLWEIHALFPTNLSLVYRPNAFSYSLTTRIINSRHRLKRLEFLNSGIFEYRNLGEEFGISYSLHQFLSFNFHAGWMFRGDLQIETYNGSPVMQIKSKGSFYLGGNFFIRF